jgi:hypothetical protein
MAAYSCIFGAFLGAAVVGDQPVGLLYIWFVMGCVGGILAAVKNSEIPDQHARTRMFLADGLAFATMLLLYSALPVYIGLARDLCILIAAAVYVSLFSHWLYAGRIIALEA